ncbi:sugar-transfer associated ATP-grasp domain-containing protein [Salinigranum salinum]|uniref:sugar-transfer associated ATP-grasp domain-containing protein n=1 Tax=Salinigranum salinum TaxID=1364937 RepID=UPI001261114B|nr:sugar-transfer associated ATP-grasp domain-containing protein [Salinigranum salinum]
MAHDDGGRTEYSPTRDAETDDGEAETDGGEAETDDGEWLTAARGWLDRQVETFGPLAALAAFLTAAGVLIGQTVGLTTALDGSRIFFQIVLAGAVMAVLRNEVGLRTYGLFAPVVIAFIMLGAGPFWGLVLFVNVLVVTLVSHRALDPLKLGTAPRVAVLLSVAGIATALAFAAAGQGLLPAFDGSGSVFFPTIISAWYADRAATEVEERGWTVPAKRLLGTLVAVVLAYAVIANEALVDWFVTTPVAWGVTLLAVAYLGSRPSFRLSEYRRFGGHFDGSLGPLSVAATRCRLRAGRLTRSLARLAGREVDEPEISASEVLGMKRRNRYIETYNPPHLRPAADEKAHVNRRLTGVGVDSPRTYAVVDDTADLDAVRRVVEERDEFVIKPSKGYGGEGIVVVSGCDGDSYDTSQGSMTARELVDHARRIVDGQYSGLESEGKAIVEEKLRPAEFMRDLHGDGVADVRVIVFQGYPVMAMTRLPTEESGGAANLHLGAVGVGLSVADGTPLGAYQQSRDRDLDAHPDTGASLTDFRMPNWDAVLETAVEAAAVSGLGYTGVDVVLGEGNVPKVLEVNVRPGLGIQNTTGHGLFRRLAFVESLPPEYEYLPADRKLTLAREWDAAGYTDDVLPDEVPEMNDTRTTDERAVDESTAAEPTADEPETGATHTATAESREPADETGTTSTGATKTAATQSAEATADTTDEPSDAESAAAVDAGVDVGGDADWSADGSRSRTDVLGSRLRTLGGGLTSGVCLVGALVGGFPVLTVLFVLVAVGFVGGLCCEAFGRGGVLGGDRE